MFTRDASNLKLLPAEEEALRKYPPCRQLVLSVINNVKGDNAIAGAIDALGWDVENLESIAGEEVLP